VAQHGVVAHWRMWAAYGTAEVRAFPSGTAWVIRHTRAVARIAASAADSVAERVFVIRLAHDGPL